jgi:hypothetical protein
MKAANGIAVIPIHQERRIPSREEKIRGQRQSNHMTARQPIFGEISFSSPCNISKMSVQSWGQCNPLQQNKPKSGSMHDLRQRLVGEVDLLESAYRSRHDYSILIQPLGEEPLLKESKRRFVLFPIQYKEV